MINLIPTSDKQAIRYARLNTRLVVWILGIGAALLALCIVVGGSLFYLKQDTNRYAKSAEEINAVLEKNNEKEIIARVNEMSGNIKLTLDVLSKEVLFSKLLTEIGNVMPPSTVLTSLSLDSQLSGAIDLTILSADYESGVKAQVNLTNATTNIFTQADIGSVQCGNTDNSTYPCTSSIRALFSEDNDSFLKLYEEKAE